MADRANFAVTRRSLYLRSRFALDLSFLYNFLLFSSFTCRWIICLACITSLCRRSLILLTCSFFSQNICLSISWFSRSLLLRTTSPILGLFKELQPSRFQLGYLFSLRRSIVSLRSVFVVLGLVLEEALRRFRLYTLSLYCSRCSFARSNISIRCWSSLACRFWFKNSFFPSKIGQIPVRVGRGWALGWKIPPLRTTLQKFLWNHLIRDGADWVDNGIVLRYLIFGFAYGSCLCATQRRRLPQVALVSNR